MTFNTLLCFVFFLRCVLCYGTLPISRYLELVSSGLLTGTFEEFSVSMEMSN